jgi:hypothetical protein
MGWIGRDDCGVQPVIWKLLLALTAAVALLGSLYLEVENRNLGVLDAVKPQQAPVMRSAKTIRDYRQ